MADGGIQSKYLVSVTTNGLTELKSLLTALQSVRDLATSQEEAGMTVVLESDTRGLEGGIKKVSELSKREMKRAGQEGQKEIDQALGGRGRGPGKEFSFKVIGGLKPGDVKELRAAITALTIAVDQLPKRIGATRGGGTRGDLEITNALVDSPRARPAVTKTAARESKKELGRIVDAAVKKRDAREKSANESAQRAAGKLGLTGPELEGLISGTGSISSLTVGGSNTQSRAVEQAALKARLARARAAEARELKKSFDPTVKSLDYFDDKMLNDLIKESELRQTFFSKKNNLTNIVKTSNRGLPRYKQSVVTPQASTPSAVSEIGGIDALGRAEGTLSKLGNLLQANVLEPLTNLANIGKELGTAAQELQALRDLVKEETEGAITRGGDTSVRAGLSGPRTYGERRLFGNQRAQRPLGQSRSLEVGGAVADFLVSSGLGADDKTLKAHAEKILRINQEHAEQQQAAKGALIDTKLQGTPTGEFIRSQANRGVIVVDAAKFSKLTNKVDNVQKLLFEDARDERGRIAIKAGAPYNESDIGRGAVRPDALRGLAGSIDQVGRLRFQEDALNNLIRGTLDELSGLEVSARKAISYQRGDTSGFAGLPQRAQTFLKLFKTLRTQFDAVRAERRKIDPSNRPSTSALDATEMIAVLNQIGLPQIAKQVDVNFGNQDYEQVARGFKPTADLVTALTSGDDAVVSQSFKKLFSSRSKRTIAAQRYAALRSGGTREVLENLGRRVSSVKDLADASSDNEPAQERARSRGVDPAMAKEIVGLADYQLRYLTKVAKEAIDILRPLDELTNSGQVKGVTYGGESDSISDKRAALLKAIRAGGGTKAGAPAELIKAIGNLRRGGAAGFYDNEALGGSLGRARTLQREIEPLQTLLQEINTRQASGGDALEGILPALERGGFKTGTVEQRVVALRARLGGKVGQFGGALSQLRALATSAAGAQGGATALRGDVDRPDAAILGQYQSLIDKNPLFKKLFHIDGSNVKTLQDNLKRFQEVVKEFELLDKILLGLRNKEPRNFGKIQELAFDIKELVRASQEIDAARRGSPGVLDPTDPKKKRYKIGQEPKAPLQGEQAQLVQMRVANTALANLERQLLVAPPEQRAGLQTQLDRAKADQGNYYNQSAGKYANYLLTEKGLPIERLFGTGGDHAQTAISEILSLVERIDPRAAKIMRTTSAGFGAGGVTGPGAGIYRDPAAKPASGGLVDVSGIAALRDLDLQHLVSQFRDMSGFAGQISTSFRALRGLDAFLKVLNKEQLAKFRAEMLKMVQDARKSGAGFGFSTKEEESQRRYEKLSPGAKKLQSERSVAATTEQIRRADEAADNQRKRYEQSRAFFDSIKDTQEQARAGLTPAIRTPGLLGGPVAPVERKRLLADLNRRYKEAQLIDDKKTRQEVTQGLLAQMSELDPDLSPATQRVKQKNRPLYRYDAEVESESRRQAELRRRAELEVKVKDRQQADNLARQALGIGRIPQAIPSATTQVASSSKPGSSKSVEALLVESQQRGRLREDLKNMLDKTRAAQALLGNTDVQRGTPAPLRSSAYRDARTMNLKFDRNEEELKSAGFTAKQRYLTRRRVEFDALSGPDQQALVRQAYAKFRYTPEQQGLESERINSDRFLEQAIGRRLSPDRRVLSLPVDSERRVSDRRGVDNSYDQFIAKSEREAMEIADRRRSTEERKLKRAEKLARDQAFAGFTPQERRDTASRGALDKYTQGQSAATLYTQGGLFHRAIQEATLQFEEERKQKAEAKVKKDTREARQKLFGQLNPEQRQLQLGRDSYDRTFGALPPGVSFGQAYAAGLAPNYNSSVSAEIENQRIEKANTEKRRDLARQQALRDVRQTRARKEIERLAAAAPTSVLEDTDPIALLQTLGKQLKKTANLQIATQQARTGVALAGPIGGSTLEQAQRGLGRSSFNLASNYAFVDDLVRTGIDTIPGFDRFRPDAEQLGQINRRRRFAETHLNAYTEQTALAQAPGLPPEERARSQRNAERELSALRRVGIKDATDARRVIQQLTDAEEKHRQTLRKGVADTLQSLEADEARLGVLDTLLDKVRQVSLYAGAGFFVYGLIQGFRQTIQEAIALEAAVTRVQGVLGKGGPEIRTRITSEIFQASRDFGAKPAAGAQAYQVFAQAGLEGDDLTRAVRASLSAEVGAGLEPQQAQELLIAVHALTGGAITFENIIDRISKIEAKYAVSAQDLAVSLQRVGSLAQQLQPNPVGRIDFADLINAATTQIVTLTRVTGNQAATSLRFIFARLLSPDTSKKLNNNFGVSLYSDPAGKNIRPLQDILADIGAKYRELNEPGPGQSTTRANQLLQIVAGARQINAAAALFSDFGKVMDIAKESAESFGSAQARTVLQMETLEKRMAQLDASFASLTAGIFRATGIEGASKLLVSTTAKGLGAAAQNPLIGTAVTAGGLAVAGHVLPKALVGISKFLGIVSGSGIDGALGQLSNPAFTKFSSRIGIFFRAFAKLSLVLTALMTVAEILDNLPFNLEFAGLQNKHRRQYGFGKLPFDKARDSEEYQAFSSLASGFVRSKTTLGRDRVGEFSGTPFTATTLQAEVLRRAAGIEGRFRAQGLGKFFPTPEEEQDLKDKGLERETRRDLRDAIGKDLVRELKDAGIDLDKFGDQTEQTAEAFKILRDALKFANFAPTFRSEQLQTQSDEALTKAKDEARKSIEKGSGLLYSVRNFFGSQATDRISKRDFEADPAAAAQRAKYGLGAPQSVAQEILRSITGGYSAAFENVKFPNGFGKTATFLEAAAQIVEEGAEEFAKGTKTAGDAYDAVTLRWFTLSKEEASRLSKIRADITAEEHKAKPSQRRTTAQVEDEVTRRLLAGGDTRAVGVLANERVLDDQIRQAYRQRFDVKGREGSLTGDVHTLLAQTEGGRITADKVFERVQKVSSEEIQRLARSSGVDSAAAARLAATAEAAGSQSAFRTAYDPTGGRRAARSRLVELLGQFQVQQTEIQGLGGPQGAFTRAGVQYDVLRERQSSGEGLVRGLNRLVPEVQLDLARIITQIPAMYRGTLEAAPDESLFAGLDENQRNLLLKDQAGREAGLNRELAVGTDPKTIENLKTQARNIQAQLELLRGNEDALKTLPEQVRSFVLGSDQPITNETLGQFLIGIRDLSASLPELREAAVNMLEAARTATREREQRAVFLGQDIAQNQRLTELTIQGRGTLRAGRQRFADLRGPEAALRQSLTGLVGEGQELRLRDRTRFGDERLRIEQDETITNEKDRKARLDALAREQLQSELYITEQVEARRREILQATYLDLLTQQEQGIQAAVAQGTSGFRDVFRTFRGAFPSKDGSGPNEDSLFGRLLLPAADQLTGGFADQFHDSLFGTGGLLEKQARGLFGKSNEAKYADLLQSAHEIGIQNGADYLVAAIEGAFADIGLGGGGVGNYSSIDGADGDSVKVAAKLRRLTNSPLLDSLFSVTGRPKGGIVLRDTDYTMVNRGQGVSQLMNVGGEYLAGKDQIQISALGLKQDDEGLRDIITHELGHRLSHNDPQLSVDFRRYLAQKGGDVNDSGYGTNFQEQFARSFAEAREMLDTATRTGQDPDKAYAEILRGDFRQNQGTPFFVDYLLNRPEYANHRMAYLAKGLSKPGARPFGQEDIDKDILKTSYDEFDFMKLARETNPWDDVETGSSGPARKRTLPDRIRDADARFQEWERRLTERMGLFDEIDPTVGAPGRGNQIQAGPGLDLATDLMLQSHGYSPYRENRGALGNRVQSTGGTNDTRYLDQFIQNVGTKTVTKGTDAAVNGLFKNPKLNKLLLSSAQLGGAFLGTKLGGNNTGSTTGASIGTVLGGGLTSKSFGGLFSFLGGAAGPVGALAGGVLGGLVGGLFGGKKEGPRPELSSLEQIERNTRETYTVMSQAGQMFNLDNRLLNVPASYVVPTYRPVAAGGGGGGGVTYSGPSQMTVQQSVSVTIQDARDPDAVARAVDRTLKSELRRGGTYVNKHY